LNIQFYFELRELPLRYEWKLSRNSYSSKINGFVTAQCNGFEGHGEAAPNIRYEETPASLQLEFDQIKEKLNAPFEHNIWHSFLDGLKICSALKMALDMAFQNLLAHISGKTLADYLGFQPIRSRSICYTIPVMEPDRISEFIEKENLSRFSWLKIKVNQELALPIVNEVLKLFQGPIAIDGNEAWTEKELVFDFIHKLPKDRILFLEQPFPSALRAHYEWLAEKSPIEIWGDESILNVAEPEYWKVAFKGINVKLMKTGTIANAIHLLKVARTIGLKTMIGCMVETSLGISAALSLESLADYMDLDGFLLLENEPFGLVKEKNGMVELSLK